MSTKKSFGLAAAAVAAIAVIAVAPAYAGPPTDRPAPGTGPQATATVTAPLTEAEKAEIRFQREEERMAKELYQAFGEKWGVTEFTRIATSEQRHFNALGRVMTRYQLEQPATEVGTYADQQLQKRYDDWLKRGMESKEAAFAVGAELEKTDIDGLQKAIDASDNAVLDRVYGHLKAGSENHLKAFEALGRGETPALGQHQGNGHRAGPGRMGQGGTGPGAHHRQGDPENCPAR